jgi:O-antigen ligase
LNINIIKHRYIDQIKKDLVFDHQNLKLNLLETKYLNQSVFSYEILKNNIFFGVGNKNYHKACINLKNTSKDRLISEHYFVHCYTHPHQVYYEFIAEHGIFGTLIILVIFYKLLFSDKKIKISENKKKLIILLKIYCLSSFLPIIPTGSFFSSFQLLLFFMNYGFYQVYILKNR